MAGLLRIPPPWPCTARAWSWLATPDATVTAQATTVAVKGRQANQGGDAIEIESSEFGRDASRVFDSLSNTGNRAKQFVTLCQSGLLWITMPSSSLRPDSRFCNP